MNNKRRKALREAIRSLDIIAACVDAVCDQEQDSADNTPDSLQESERFERMEENVESLRLAVEKLGEARDAIMDAIG